VVGLRSLHSPHLAATQGLRLLHPFLPFVTEELYQRLPASDWKSETIMLSQYPTEVCAWENPNVCDQMELLQAVCKGIRSLAVSVNLHPRERPAAFVRTSQDKIRQSLKGVLPQASIMGKCGKVEVLSVDAPVPAGSVASVLNDTITVYLQVADLVDLGKEVAKQEKKLEENKKKTTTLQQKMADANYEQRVPADVRAQNTEKLQALQTEKGEVEGVIAALKKAMAK